MCAMTAPKHLNNMKYNTVPHGGIRGPKSIQAQGVRYFGHCVKGLSKLNTANSNIQQNIVRHMTSSKQSYSPHYFGIKGQCARMRPEIGKGVSGNAPECALT
jgi:hypothetical protein